MSLLGQLYIYYEIIYELFNKSEKGKPLTRKLFKAITEFDLNISIFYDITKTSCHDFWMLQKQNPNLSFTTIKDNVQYTTLKDLTEEEQKSWMQFTK